MIPNVGVLSTPPDQYQIDDAILGLHLATYLNERYDDCVIAARCHHTVRLTYSPAGSILEISDQEVSAEYFAETGGPDNGLMLNDSLQRWQVNGWTAGGISGRRIKAFHGPLKMNGSAMASGDAGAEIDPEGVKRLIIEHVGIQADLELPDGIRAQYKTTFGPGTLWSDTSDWGLQRHVMLLTGYDQEGPIGITWGMRQKMTWQFLKKYLRGIYWVEKDETT